MKLSIHHRTQYNFEVPAGFALQRLQLTPRDSTLQKVLSWEVTLTGATKQLEYVNGFGNHVQLNKIDEGASEIVIEVNGEVETFDQAGILGSDSDIPLWILRRPTLATTLGQGLRQFSKGIKWQDNEVTMLHDIMNQIRDAIPYVTATTEVETTAEESWQLGTGVCQDHSHMMIAVAREFGYAARYVSGYLLMDGVIDQTATHAWCEIFVESLGWVGFDVSNGISPDERYVKIATGRDYSDAAPVAGIRYGQGEETLEVHLQIQQ